MKTKIYALRENGFVRYVGKTSRSLGSRLAAHLEDARRRARTHKEKWIHSLLCRGILPTITLITEVAGDGGEEEKQWISFFVKHGIPLTNGTEGGTGGNVWAFSSKRDRDQFSRRMSQITKGRVVSETVRQKTARTLTGHSVSEATRRKISQINKGRKLSESTRAKMRARIVSEETRQKMSRSLMGHRGVVHTEVTKRKMRAAKLGKAWTAARRFAEECRKRQERPTSDARAGEDKRSSNH